MREKMGMNNKSVALWTEKKVIEELIAPLLSKREHGESLDKLDDVRDILPHGARIVVNIDGGDIPRMKYPWRTYADVGWTAVVGVMSDHLAKGSIPYAMLVSLGVTPNTSVNDLKNLLEGIYAATREYGLRYLGGDLNSSNSLWISIAIIGFTSAKKLPTRDGAKPGDKIVVVGKYGASGVIALEGTLYAKLLPWVIEATQRPYVKTELAYVVAKHYRVIHASMDTSDGLGYTLYEISKRSKVKSILVDKPLHYEELYQNCIKKIDTEKCIWSLILSGGEEYGAVFYVDPRGVKDFTSDLEAYGIPYKVVGEAMEGEPGVKVKDVKELEVMYWDQFTGWKKLYF